MSKRSVMRISKQRHAYATARCANYKNAKPRQKNDYKKFKMKVPY